MGNYTLNITEWVCIQTNPVLEPLVPGDCDICYDAQSADIYNIPYTEGTTVDTTIIYLPDIENCLLYVEGNQVQSDYGYWMRFYVEPDCSSFWVEYYVHFIDINGFTRDIRILRAEGHFDAVGNSIFDNITYSASFLDVVEIVDDDSIHVRELCDHTGCFTKDTYFNNVFTADCINPSISLTKNADIVEITGLTEKEIQELK